MVSRGQWSAEMVPGKSSVGATWRCYRVSMPAAACARQTVLELFTVTVLPGPTPEQRYLSFPVAVDVYAARETERPKTKVATEMVPAFATFASVVMSIPANPP